MKHLFSYIVFGILFFNVAAYAGNKYPLPDDFAGTATRQILQTAEENSDGDEVAISMADQLSITYEAAGYLYQKYNLEDFAQKNFIKKIRPFFPWYTEDQLENRRALLYAGAGMYQYGKQKYTDFIKKHLVPPAHKKIRSEADYDHPNEVPYIEAKDGEFVKVYNFKKFLTYSEDPDEQKLIREFEANKNKDSFIQQINSAVSKIEWKKVGLYGTKYTNPLYSTNGISPIQRAEFGTLRLVTDGEFIDNRPEIYIALLVIMPPKTFVLANNLNFRMKKPQLDLSKSQNIAPDYQILYPVPVHSSLYPEIYKYVGTFMILAKIKPIDHEKTIVIHAQTDITECNYKSECIPQHFTFVQALEPHGDDLFGNGMGNFFFRARTTIPPAEQKNLRLTEFSAQKDSSGNSLYLVFESKKNINTFNLFIEETDAYTTFKEPLISLRDNKIYVRTEPTEMFAEHDLSNAEYTVTANLNGKYFLRQTLVPTATSNSLATTTNLGFGFFIFAFIAGLLLSFMPCVLPIWAFKILSMYVLHKKPETLIRADIRQTLSGVVVTAIVAFGLLLFKAIYSPPYIFGAQLQNMAYIMCLLFGGILLIKLLPYLFDNIAPTNMRFLNFILGALGGIFALSCGAPYLSETVNTAANENIGTLWLTFIVILCSFISPFALLLKNKNIAHILTWFHNHKKYVGKIIKYALGLAFVWYILLIWWQTGFAYAIKIISAAAIFWFLVAVWHKFLIYLDGVHDESVTLQHLQKIKCGCYVFITLLTLGFILTASISATHRQNKLSRQNIAQSTAFLDLEKIDSELKQKHSVLVAIETDWCLRCQLNRMLTFNQLNLDKWANQHHLSVIRLNQENLNTEIMDFIKRHNGKTDIPFYVIYTPVVKNGIVLPSRPSVEVIERLLIYNQVR